MANNEFLQEARNLESLATIGLRVPGIHEPEHQLMTALNNLSQDPERFKQVAEELSKDNGAWRRGAGPFFGAPAAEYPVNAAIDKSPSGELIGITFTAQTASDFGEKSLSWNAHSKEVSAVAWKY